MSIDGGSYDGQAHSGKGAELVKRAEKAFQTPERYNAERTWYQLAEFILPSQNSEFFRNPVKGVRRDRRVFDSTAIQSNRDLASAMQSTITNPSMKWSSLRFKEDALNEPKGVDQWLLSARDEFHNTLSESNFDSQMSRCYPALSGLGQMILFHDELHDGEVFKGFNFQAWHLAECAYEENHLGYIDTIYRRFKMTVSQLIKKFGDAVGQEVKDKCEKQPNLEMEVFHCIYPRELSEIKLNEFGLGSALERPFSSCYVLRKGFKLLQEDGYYEFPCYVARWSVLPGEVYGYGPGNVCLADVRTINKMREEKMKSMAKANNPPIFTTKQNIMSGDMRPGGISFVRDINQLKEFVTQARFDVVKDDIDQLANSIKSSFYIDKLLLPPRTETGEMSAYEVQQRLSQMQQILGPVLGRLDAEFLNPLVMRSLKILLRAKKIAPLPLSINNRVPTKKGMKVLDVEVAFVNALARSQQMAELQNIQSFIQETLQIMQGTQDTSILDNIDMDAVIEYAAKVRNIPNTMVRSEEDVKALRDKRQKQQMAQQALAGAESMSNTAKNVGQSGLGKPPEGTA